MKLPEHYDWTTMLLVILWMIVSVIALAAGLVSLEGCFSG